MTSFKNGFALAALFVMFFAIRNFASDDNLGASLNANDGDIGTLVYSWANKSSDGGFVTSIAYDPSSSSTVWASGDDTSGIYKSTDGGVNWTLKTASPTQQSSYSIVIDPTNSSKVYAPSHFGRGVLKTTDGGTNWSVVGAGLPSGVGENKRLWSMAIDPSTTSTLYAATTGGLYKSTDSGANFTQLTSANFTRGVDQTNSAKIYAVTEYIATPGIGAAADNGVYYSSDSGASWTYKVALQGVATRPGSADTAVALGTDAYVTTNNFGSVTSLGLGTYAPGKSFIASTFVSSTTLLVGSSTGELYKTTNFSTSGSVTWSTVSIPSNLTMLHDILVTADNKWYIACFNGDVQWNSGATPGLLVSYDQGATWAFENTGLYPSRSIWKIVQDPSNASIIWAGMWGAGIFKYTR